MPSTHPSSSAFDSWIADGFAHLAQLKHAATFSPSPALAADISARTTVLKELLNQHSIIANVCSSPFLRLPRELQERIFVDVAAEEHVLDWIGLGQICSALRVVLLNMQRLWGEAIYSWSSGLHRDELLERAGPTAPLTLLVFQEEGPEDAAEFAITHLDRARKIKSDCPSFIHRFIQNIDSHSLPYLDEVVLNLHANSTESMFALDKAARATPRLRRVCVHDVYWNSSAPNLTSLALHSFQSHPAYTYRQFIDLLQQHSRLLYLHLFYSIPHPPDESPASDDTLSFPHLESLYVSDRPHNVCQLWRLLTVPLDAIVSVTLDYEHASVDQTAPSNLQDLALFKRHIGGQQCLMLEADNTFGLAFSVLPKPSVAEREKVYISAGPHPTFNFEYCSLVNNNTSATNARGLERRILLQACSQLDLFNVVHLRLLGSYGEGLGGDWRDVLGRFTHLEHLEVEHFTDPMCSALGRLPGRQSLYNVNALTLSPLIPRLRQLTVRNAILHHRLIQGSRAVPCAAFVDMMQSCSDQGRPLDALTFQKLTILPADGAQKARVAFIETIRSRFPSCRISLS